MSERVVQGENPDYLSKQLITYIGNKRALISFIENGVEIVLKRLGKRQLKIFDVFSGSGIVSRFFKRYASKLIVNDLEDYVEVINKCYLANRSELDIPLLRALYSEIIQKLTKEPLVAGFITELYAPENDDDIKPGERVFYTRRNAMYIDTARRYMEAIPEGIRCFYLAPLLSEASVHANTSGVFKGFYKDPRRRVGKFGGKNGDALDRIKGDIVLPFPVFSNYECDVAIYKGDSNVVVNEVEEVDMAYIDPPYNQHPYGSNYFMLNLIVNYRRPHRVSEVSGIPSDWKRSFYNKRNHAYRVFSELVHSIKAKYLLISFNSEGFISVERMLKLLKGIGNVKVLETRYNTFRGSRNLRNRSIHVTEYLYLVEKW